GADIAASSFTGMIEYTSFQAEWLLKAYKKSTSITQLIESEWKYLSIKELSLPESVQLVVGWTGSPASTKSLVKQLRKLKDKSIVNMLIKLIDQYFIEYKSFFKSSIEYVDYILEGLKKNNQGAIYTGIEENRKALALVGQLGNVEIETANHYGLRRAAKKLS